MSWIHPCSRTQPFNCCYRDPSAVASFIEYIFNDFILIPLAAICNNYRLYFINGVQSVSGDKLHVMCCSMCFDLCVYVVLTPRCVIE